MTLDDDAVLTYNGPFARVPRPMTVKSLRSLLLTGGLLFMSGGLTIIPVTLGWTTLADSNVAGMTVLAVASVVGALPLVFVSRAPAETLRWAVPQIVTVGFVIALMNISLAMVFVGPTFGGASLFFPQVALLAFIALRRNWAIAATVLSMVGFSLAQAALDHPVAPVQHFFNVAATAVAGGVLIGGLTNRLDAAQAALADVNGRLRRFLAPQVADAVTTNAESLTPHRREIAVFFVDLRGFTAFTNAVAPALVVDVLAQYYAAVGAVVDKYAGTIGGFDGDGVFAFLGDPVPNDDAAADALAMAKDVASQLDALTHDWSRGAPSLGYGIGLAYGEATIGLVGFEGRLDYTPVGACVNLASRLCADALHGEIVIDNALRKVTGVKRPRRRDDVNLKGFGVTKTFAVPH